MLAIKNMKATRCSADRPCCFGHGRESVREAGMVSASLRRNIFHCFVGCVLGGALFLFVCRSADARTVVIDAGAADRMAVIAESAPRLSWAGYERWPAIYSTIFFDIVQGRSFLIRFQLGEIPKGQCITHAELIVPVDHCTGNAVRFYLWRILADWGSGVCHMYRAVYPEKREWTRAGARGYSSDRATRPSAIVQVNKKGEYVVNVTEDVELWYTGAAPNNGWIFTVEDVGTLVRFPSPVWESAQLWRIRITYEPE